MNISLRNMSVGYTETREALEEFFKTHKVCGQCKGKGYVDKKFIKENMNPTPMKIDISKSKYLVKNVEKIDKFSDVAKDAIYRHLGMRKTCPKCKGEKFLAK